MNSKRNLLFVVMSLVTGCLLQAQNGLFIGNALGRDYVSLNGNGNMFWTLSVLKAWEEHRFTGTKHHVTRRTE